MEARALIIAIENYSQAQGLFTQSLEGTLDSASRFYQWLLSEKRVKPESIFLCSDKQIASGHPPNRPNRGGDAGKIVLIRGSSRSDIVATCLDLIDLGQDDTSELFVFFSGHGLAYRESPWRLALDVLICSDFRNFRDSGAAGIKLDELRVRLCTCLGGTDHYFLIDACRNVVDKSLFQPIGLGISPTAAQLGTPTVYTLYSVKFGEPAPVNPKFANALITGLHGDGHAKGWVQGEMFVKFDLLRDYVKEQVKPRQIDYRQDGDGKGALLQLPAPVTSHCEVVVVDASPEQKFHLAVTSGPISILATDFSGSSFTHQARTQRPDLRYASDRRWRSFGAIRPAPRNAPRLVQRHHREVPPRAHSSRTSSTKATRDRTSQNRLLSRANLRRTSARLGPAVAQSAFGRTFRKAELLQQECAPRKVPGQAPRKRGDRFQHAV